MLACLFAHLDSTEVDDAMKYPPLMQLNGVFGVIKPRGITAAKTCNRIRADLVKGNRLYLIKLAYCHFVTCFDCLP